MAQPRLVSWPAVFVAYCQNHPLEEIAASFDIKISALRERITADKWEALRAAMPNAVSGSVAVMPGAKTVSTNPFVKSVTPLGPPVTSLTPQLRAALETLQKNRQLNLNQVTKLRAYLDDVLEKLATGTFKIEVGRNIRRDGSMEYDVVTRDPNPQEVVAIVTAVKMMQEIGYRALGDIQATEKGSGRDLPPGAPGSGAAAPITIILPPAIAQPRQARQKIKEQAEAQGHVVVDVEAEVTKAGVPPAPEATQPPKPIVPTSCQVCDAEDPASGPHHDPACPHHHA